MQREAHLTNAALMARRRAAVARGVGQTHEIFVARARNAELWDVEGKRYIDFAGGIAVLNTGHCSLANQVPVRPAPVCTSSAISRMP